MAEGPDAESASVQMLVREKTPSTGLFHQLAIEGQSTAEIMRAIDQEPLLGTVQHTTRLMPLGLSLPVII